MLEESSTDANQHHHQHLEAFASTPLAKELSRELNRVPPAPMTTFGAAPSPHNHNDATPSPHHNGATAATLKNNAVNGGVSYGAVISTGSAPCYPASSLGSASALDAGFGGGGGGGGGVMANGGKFHSTLNPLYHVSNGSEFL